MNSERDIIAHIKAMAGEAAAGLLQGIGDDCAVIRGVGSRCWLLTLDTLVESVHFDARWHPPVLLGRKSGSVNISDVAAMGGEPRFALLSLALPASLPAEWLEDFLQGFMAVLREQGVMLIGGDTVKADGAVQISVTLIGEAEEERILYRSGAAPGDLVWVSGPLGRAAAGLELCRRGWAGRADLPDDWQKLIDWHLDPQPRTALGRQLAESGVVTAMMDISDGIATDLAHICAASGVGSEIEAHSLPLPPGLVEAARELGASPLEWALRGGEDYELLFTTPPGEAAVAKLREQAGKEPHGELFPIGRIVAGEGVILCGDGERRQIAFQGHDHFGAPESE